MKTKFMIWDEHNFVCNIKSIELSSGSLNEDNLIYNTLWSEFVRNKKGFFLDYVNFLQLLKSKSIKHKSNILLNHWTVKE